MAGDNKVDGDKNNGDETNLLNSFISKKFIGAGYQIFKNAKKSGSDNNIKGAKVNRGFDCLTTGAKKAFNLYGTYLHKHLFFNTLIRNNTSGLKSTYKTMLLVEF